MSERRLTRIQAGFSLFLTCLVICLVSVCYQAGLFSWIDFYIFDRHTSFRGPMETAGSIVLVSMDEKSAIELKRHKGTWSRLHLAQALNNLTEAGAEIIGLDFILSSPDLDPEVDRILADTMERCNNVILAWSAQGDGVFPMVMFQEAMLADGFIDLQPDRDDQILRNIRFLNPRPLEEEGGLQLLPSFSLELARSFGDIEFELDFSEEDHFLMGVQGEKQLILPYPDLLINFHGNYASFPNLSYADVVMNRFSPEIVSGKIVIIGSCLITDKDFFATPFTRFLNSVDQLKDKFGSGIEWSVVELDYGMSCHANGVETILSQKFPRRIKSSMVFTLVLLMGLLGMLVYTSRISMFWEMILIGIGLAALTGVSHLLFVKSLVWIEVAPLMSVLLLQFVGGVSLQKFFERKKKALITTLFGRYVSSRVVDELISGDIEYSLEGRRQELTMLFSDIRGFTTMSERLGARDTSLFLNTYFSAMIPLVFKYQGTLDKLMGDAVMAFFGAPVYFSDHPVKAAQTALDMLDALNRLKENREVRGIGDLDVGIGINTDEVTVGNLGSDEFMDYTVIGDPVNLASRLEGLNKVYGTKIILSEFTAAKLDERFLLRELDTVRVKGKGDAVTLFELMGYRDKAEDKIVEMKGIFESGLAEYRKKEWDSACQAFEKVLQLRPDDPPSKLYLARIEEFRKSPPADDWDGVTAFSHK